MIDRVQTAHRRADCVVSRSAAIVLAGLVLCTRVDQYTVYSPPAPHPAPVAAVQIAALPAALAPARVDQSECLAEVLYYEARGEGMEGQKAVAEVVLQRTRDMAIPARSAALCTKAPGNTGQATGVASSPSPATARCISRRKGQAGRGCANWPKRSFRVRSSWPERPGTQSPITTSTCSRPGRRPWWKPHRSETTCFTGVILRRYRIDETGAAADAVTTGEDLRDGGSASGNVSEEVQSKVQIPDTVGEGA